jgi:hypothetical protein
VDDADVESTRLLKPEQAVNVLRSINKPADVAICTAFCCLPHDPKQLFVPFSVLRNSVRPPFTNRSLNHVREKVPPKYLADLLLVVKVSYVIALRLRRDVIENLFPKLAVLNEVTASAGSARIYEFPRKVLSLSRCPYVLMSPEKEVEKRRSATTIAQDINQRNGVGHTAGSGREITESW